MRIAQVAPLYESVPPKAYGGTERVVSWLTEELVRQGHQVTLFASGDSVTAAELVAPWPRSLRLDRGCVDQLAHHLVLLEQVFRQAERFDFIHFHVDYLHFPWSRRHPRPRLTTLHGRLDIPDLPALYREFPDEPVVSISDAQRRPLPWLNWQGTVYHGQPPDLIPFRETPGDYLAFLGRVSREKRPDRAVEIARRAGLKLKVAAKIDKVDEKYFHEEIEALFRDPAVEYLGELGGRAKRDFLGGAKALLFPIDWPEPFGLVMIEAMAAGTPVIAWNCGSVPEVMEDGVTGFVVESIDAAVDAVGRLDSLDRRKCRAVFDARFTADRMARDYVALYEKIWGRGRAGEKSGSRLGERRSPPGARPEKDGQAMSDPLAHQAERKSHRNRLSRSAHVESIATAVAIKDEDLFFLCDPEGRVPIQAGHGLGLYVHDCRFLNGYEKQLGGDRPGVLGADARCVYQANLALANKAFRATGGTHVEKEEVCVEWECLLDASQTTLYDRITVHNYRLEPTELPLALLFAASFEALFEVRGNAGREVLGRLHDAEWRDGTLHFRYDGADDVRHTTTIHFHPAPERFSAVTPAAISTCRCITPWAATRRRGRPARSRCCW